MPNDRIEAVEKSGSKPFGVLLTLGLALPLLIAIGTLSGARCDACSCAGAGL
jgi:hypothetical protein